MSRINVANFRHPDGTDDNISLDSSGRVGIGTASPAYKCDIDVTGSALRLNSTTTSAKLVISSDDAASARIEFGDESDDDRGAIIYDNPSNALIFQANATERARIDFSGNLKFNSGYGSVATAYGVRAWVNFNGEGAVAIRGSGNVSSITDNGTGYYTVNFTNNMPDANYGVVTGLGDIPNNAEAGFVQAPFATTPSTSAFRFRTVNTNYTTETDCEYVYLTFIR